MKKCNCANPDVHFNAGICMQCGGIGQNVIDQAISQHNKELKKRIGELPVYKVDCENLVSGTDVRLRSGDYISKEELIETLLDTKGAKKKDEIDINGELFSEETAREIYWKVKYEERGLGKEGKSPAFGSVVLKIDDKNEVKYISIKKQKELF